MTLKAPIVESMPSVQEVRYQLGDALREVELLRGLLRLAERAERYREVDREMVNRRPQLGEAAHG